MNKPFIILTVCALCSLQEAEAQSGTNSPYSGYGLGKMADVSIGRSRGMAGTGVAIRESGHVNYLNPASYSAIDSLTFIFDVGMSLQNTNFKENGKSKNAKNGDFEYAVGSFRALRHLGMSFGIMPYSNVGYNYSAQDVTVSGYNQAPYNTEETKLSSAFSGSGGFHQLFVGAGWEIAKGLSVGANVNYLFGTISNSVAMSFSDSYARTMQRNYEVSVNNVKFDLGASYSMMLNKKDELTVGLTFTPGYRMGADAECTVITKNSQSSVNDTTVFTATNAVAIPTQWALGLGYRHGTRWVVGLDYSMQRWSKIEARSYMHGSETVGNTDTYSDRHRISAGAEYCKNDMGRYFTDRIRYRFGASYTSSYLKINGKDGPSAFSLSAGVGLPIRNRYASNSMVNVALEWSRASAKDLITENTFLINIGLTFNERWFEKWKFD